jgi:sporulation protein YqfC
MAAEGWMGEFLDVSRDAFLDLPKLVMVGRLMIGVENHRGIVEYNPGRIRIAVNEGEICVAGQNLAVERLSRDRIDIKGVVFSIDFGTPYLEEASAQ